MTKYTISSIFTVIVILLINFPYSEERVIYFGNCPLVIGGKCDSTLVKFYLYNRINPIDPTYVVFNDDGTDNLTASTYNPRLKSKVIIHGYNSDMNLNVLQNLKDEYLNSSNANIWMVNFPSVVIGPCYPFSVYNIRYVGRCIAYFITTLKAASNYNLDIHVIGFSLGGQVPNYVAQYLSFKLPRITGLDPALPLFYTNILHQRLDPSDAQFVDVIHTNALFQGQVSPCGHVDFYVNGGVFQPGCTGSGKLCFTQEIKILTPVMGVMIIKHDITMKYIFTCYHSRAVEYFAESINTPVGFWGWNCPSFTDFIERACKPKEPLKKMGEYVDPSSPGVYLVNTASKSPYALGKNITKAGNNNASIQYSVGDLMNTNWTVYSKYSNVSDGDLQIIKVQDD